MPCSTSEGMKIGGWVRAGGLLFITASIIMSCTTVPHAESTPVVENVQVQDAPPSEEPKGVYHFILGYMAELDQDYQRAIREYRLALEWDPQSVFLQVRMAVLHFARGEIQAATRYAEQVDSGKITHSETLVELAKIYAGAGKAEQALALYERAIKQAPQQPDVYFSKGILLVNLKHFEEAETVFKQGIEKDQDSPLGYYYLGRVQAETGQADKAVQQFEKAIALNPRFEPGYLALAALYESQKQYDQAAESYRRYLREINPHNKDFRQRLVRVYIRQQNYQQAIQELETILDYDPDDIDARVRLALIQGELKNYGTAVTHLQRVLENTPSELRVRDYLGLMYEEMNEYDNAIQAYRTNVRLKPTYVDSYLHLGFLFYRLKQYEEAIPSLSEAIRLDPDQAKAYLLLGLTYYQMKQYQRASEIFEEGIEHNPKSADLHFNLGTVYDKLSRFDDLVEAMETTLDLDPDHADALNYLGYSYADRGIRMKEALQLTQRAVALRPNNGYYIDSLGWALYKLGRLDQALAELKRAVDLVHDDPVIYEHLGEIYLKQHDYKKARDAWIRSLELDPSNQQLIDRFKDQGFGDPLQEEPVKRAHQRMTQNRSAR